MIEVIIFLNKFDLDLDKVKAKLKKMKVETIEDREHRLIGKLSNEEAINDIVKMNEVDKVVMLENNWEEFSFKAMREKCFSLAEKTKDNFETFYIHTRLLDAIPISAKSINKKMSSVFKKEGMTFNEKNKDVIIFIELMKDQGKKFFRIGYSSKKDWQKRKKIEIKKEILVLVEEPELVLEIGDFLRVCWIFKLKLRFLVKKDKDSFEKRLIKAMKETKSIHYKEFDMETISKMPSGDYTKIAFTRHTTKNEEDLVDLFKKNDKFMFIFGNEKFGLTGELRDKADHLIKLTPDLKKPLRGSQALTYALGISYMVK